METRREEIEVELHEIDREIYRNSDLRDIWTIQLSSPKECDRSSAQREIDEIDAELNALKERRASLQRQYDETPTTQAARHEGGIFGSFIRQMQREGRLPQD